MTDTSDDVEEQLFRLRLAGRSVRHLAKQFGRSIEEVAEICERMCTAVSPAMRRAVLALDLERIEAVQQVFYAKAMDGDAAAGALVLKCQERRSSLLGLDVPAAARGAGPVLVEITPAPETTTDRIRRALEFVAAQRLSPPGSNGHGEEPAPNESAEPAGSMQKS